jgi:TonB family protein
MSAKAAYSSVFHHGSLDERYGRPFAVSLSIHIAVFLLAIFGSYLLPRREITIGTGPGGGTGGETATVGVVDDLSGGANMVKPSLSPAPPVLEEKPPDSKSKAVALPDTLDRRIKKPTPTSKSAKTKPETNVVPTPLKPGSGGSGGTSGGSGGGAGGGIGVSIGTGSGGLETNYYARTVEQRISEKWTHPPEGVRVDIQFRFYVDSYGRIQGIHIEKSSGNRELDFMAERAISSVRDLAPPPPELQGRLIKFSVHFVYPPDKQ